MIPTFDIELFSSRLVQLMNDVDLRKNMGAKGRKKSRCYQIESVGNRWKLLFDELMQKDFSQLSKKDIEEHIDELYNTKFDYKNINWFKSKNRR